MNRRVVIGIAVAGVLLVGIALAFSPPTAEPDKPDSALTLAQTGDVDRTIFRITVFENGDARWTIENRREIPIDAEAEIEEFETYADRFVEEETETFENFRVRADQLTREGSEITDREMNATEFERDARYSTLSQEGVVEMSFLWKGFAQQNDDGVVVSDIYTGGFVILEDQILRFEHGEQIRFESVSPTPDRTESEATESPGEWVEWDGPREFGSGNPELVFVPANQTISDDPGTVDDGTDDQPDGGSDQSDEGDQPESEDGESPDMMAPLLLTVFLLVTVGGGLLWYSTSRSGGGESVSTDSPDSPPGSSPEGNSSARPIEQEQLLSDEDRVIKLLEKNDGRMRQVAIVEETDWSKSKVSMLLSEMEENGEISKLRVGRENIISLAGEEPAAAGSPFEDEESG